ncbi:MAG: HEAT repeat domain-containing protein [Thermoanaerobaculia bacterium]|nr:HEAT repeat domain-containing protein [Thermoanaerobaculia bacterium]
MWFRRFGLDVRAGECAVCWLLFAVHFLLLAFQYVGKSLRQSSFIDALGAEQLPGVYLAVALLSYPVLLLYGRLVRVFRLDRLLAVLTLLAALVTAGFGEWFRRTGNGEGLALAATALYLWTAVVAILLVSLFWSLSSHVFNARQARRLFGFLGAGGLLGSIVGGQVARLGSLWSGASGALFLGSALLLSGSFLALLFGRRFGARCEQEAEDEVPAAPVGGDPDEQVDVQLRAAREGMGTVLRSGYLRRVSLLMLLAATVAQVVDLQFGWAVERATETLHQRTAIFGNLYSVMGLAAFVFQLLFTSRIHRRLGVGFALRVLPVTNGLGAAAFLGAAFFAPAFVLPVLWLVKAAENGLRYSLDQATRELLFVPVPARRRPRAKAFVDVFVQRVAKGLAALLLLSVTFGWISVPATAWLALGCVVAWLAILGTLQRHYVAGFREGLVQRLLSGQTEELHLDLRDGKTLETLVAGLGSADNREVKHSVELLDAHGRGHLVPPLMLAHDAPGVRLEVLRVLRRGQRRDAEPWVERLLADPEPAVRVSAIRTLAALSTEDLRKPMEARLQEPDPRVRAVAVSYLATLDDPDLLSLADSSLADMMADRDPEVRIEAARALGELDEPRFQTGMVQLLYDPDDRVVRAALGAVRDRTQRTGGNPIYMPTVISLLHRRRLKHEAREALAAYGEMAIPALRHFLLDPQEPIWVRRGLPKTIARVGGEQALRVLTEALVVADSFQRRKVVEALTSMCGSGRLCPDPNVLEDRIGAECREYLRHQLDLWSLESLGVRSHLLPRLLSDRRNRQEQLVFGLLALRHPSHDVATAHRGLGSVRTSVRAHALEYLDNLMNGEVRQWVLALVDDVSRDDRIKTAQRLFGLEAEPPGNTLRRLARRRSTGDADAAWLTAAALHFIQEYRVEELNALIRRAAERDRDPLVQETAGVLLRELA